MVVSSWTGRRRVEWTSGVSMTSATVALVTMTTVGMTMSTAMSLILLGKVAYVWNMILDKTSTSKASLRPHLNKWQLGHNHFRMILLELISFLYLAKFCKYSESRLDSVTPLVLIIIVNRKWRFKF